MDGDTKQSGQVNQALRAEVPLIVVLATTLAFLAFGKDWLSDLSNPLWLALMFGWLFAVILWAALKVVHHADCLALKLGEPYGTLILTLSVISIEVLMIAALMLGGSNNPTLARDTMFAVIMIVLNGMVGLTLLLGALRHGEQSYNLQGANAYLSVIIPLALLTLALPNVTVTTAAPTLSGFQSVFLIFICVALYGTFLAIQTLRHKHYFTDPAAQAVSGDAEHGHGIFPLRSVPFHALLLLAYLIPVVLLAKKLAAPVDYGIEELHLPAALGGFIVAALVLTPEAVGAVQAALADRLQRAVNIFLGSVMATIGLTVPAVLVISLVTGKTVELGLQGADMLMLVVTLMVSMVTFSAANTNLLQGVVHLTLFLAYLMLIFAP
ncbi:calcium:proton antiporter [Thiorhodovibrio frisius]|uniref:Ca2+/H+ antiporter n=1 Tax=Thiorhodovibrio frisius TaxID=631362 RepID=H8YZQ8_9GAMM|nr:calcium:proton antiporter [Thiorhodovibrio frisius]EIC22185.1 Ca2+/H+ antiporter [Thiorhodovibrio frisius]WPL24479.1 Calcium/proton antiporter [Thiorhodovibrio frisius]